MSARADRRALGGQARRVDGGAVQRRRTQGVAGRGGARMRRHGHGNVLRWLAPTCALALALAAWQLYVDLSGVSSLVLPSPEAVVRALVRDRATLAHNLGVTALEIVLGLAAAMLCGFAVALVIHLSAFLRRALYPLLVASQAIPVVILFPLLVLWLGFGLLPKLAVIGLVCFFPIVITTMAGFERVDPELVKLMRTLDATRLQTFRHVELPSALPGVFTGAKLAAVFSVIGAVFAEWLGSDSGLGYLVNVTVANLEPAEAFAAVFVLCAFAILLFAALSLAERRALPWAYRSPTSEGR